MPRPILDPVLTTERLILRPPTIDDFADSAAMWGAPAVTRHIGGRPFTPEEVWSRLLRYVGHWQVLGFGYWVARETESGRYVGEVGFADFRRDIVPSLDGAPEIGWVVSPAAQGRGYASEAVAAALDWGRAYWGPGRTVCIIDPANTPSLRVAEKAGYAVAAEATYKDAPILLLERLG
jgi:RimJ/RimL family protein N-acetyltransferase